jgi:hypothetical protein
MEVVSGVCPGCREGRTVAEIVDCKPYAVGTIAIGTVGTVYHHHTIIV